MLCLLYIVAVVYELNALCPFKNLIFVLFSLACSCAELNHPEGIVLLIRKASILIFDIVDLLNIAEVNKSVLLVNFRINAVYDL